MSCPQMTESTGGGKVPNADLQEEARWRIWAKPRLGKAESLHQPPSLSGEGQRHLGNPDALELCGNELPNLRCFHHGHGEDRGWIG